MPAPLSPTNKTEILNQLPKLNSVERFEIFSFLWDLEEKDVFFNQQPSAEEKYLLDQAAAEYAANPNDVLSWEEVHSHILSQL